MSPAAADASGGACDPGDACARLAEAAARALGAPYAAVALFAGERAIVRGAYGFAPPCDVAADAVAPGADPAAAFAFASGVASTSVALHDVDGATIGTLCVFDRAARAFDDDARATLAALARLIACGGDLRDRDRDGAPRRYPRDLLALAASDAPLERVFAAVVRAAERARPGAGAAIALRDGERAVVAATGEALGDALGDLPPGTTLADDGDPAARAMRAERQVVVVDVACEGGDAYRDALARHAIVAVWSTPIRIGDGEVAGAFTFYAREPRAPTREDLRVGIEFAQVTGLAMERRRDRARLAFLERHDALTRLPNRALFASHARRAFDAAAAAGRRVAVGMLDLDRFAIVNDAFGHAAGDRLLREIASRLAGAARTGDTLARLGGDAFVALFADVGDREEATDRARALLHAFAASFACAGQELFVRARMGLALYPDDARDLDALLALCDAAAFVARTQARDVAFPERDELRDPVSRIALETSLAHALERAEFALVFQPQVDLALDAVRGAEALLRWNHPLLGEVLPDAFIRAAEATGLIVSIGAWVLEEACRVAERWERAGLDRFVAVNVSARQFDHGAFVATVRGALARTGLAPARLHLELTESLLMRSPHTATATLGALKALGVKLVVDDFGTGYSSFDYLKRFPVDALKIDRLFVREIGVGAGSRSDEAIVRAIVGVARALDLDVVAEGVVNREQVAFLRAAGVTLGQGFLYAPLAASPEVADPA